ncbi:helix-turn-helix domain-containing protein [Caulobacter sp. Root1472]|uniref:helix-turn-helix domain-containing protein n=1 Tax=Caulobacter sp. Root1472 TaxID=1736470 RepID=UPI001F29A492|nr:helix-turn-helix domain-containing protein [Caulobacter sp. Root1472]
MLINTPHDLGSAIRERRKALGLDQVELAAQVGASRRWLIQVENGSSGASLRLLLRTLNALGMRLSVGAESLTQQSSEQPLSTPDLDAVIARARRMAPPK